MKGLYFLNTDLGSTRAHASQVLNTAAAINVHVPLTLVAPRYGGIDLHAVARRHGLTHPPEAVVLWNFGLRRGGILSFVLFNIPAIFYLIAQKARGQIDFIYVRASYFFPVVVTAYLLRVPIFWETHRRPMTLPERMREGLIARMSRGIIAVSEQVLGVFAPYRKPILVVHDAVSLGRFAISVSRKEARARLKLPQDEPVCIYTGSISALKGIPCLIEAARLLPKVRFLLIGRMAGGVDRNEAPQNVEFLGQLPQEELPLYLRAADVALLPHPRNDYSQSPMKLFEYMASGTPVVASRLPSIKEVLNDRNALLVDPENALRLAEGIHKLLEEPVFAQHLSEQAALDVQGHTWEVRGRKIAAFVRETLKGATI